MRMNLLFLWENYFVSLLLCFTALQPYISRWEESGKKVSQEKPLGHLLLQVISNASAHHVSIISGNESLSLIFFFIVYCIENRLKINITPCGENFINWLNQGKKKKSGGLLFFFLISTTEKLWDGLSVFQKWQKHDMQMHLRWPVKHSFLPCDLRWWENG